MRGLERLHRRRHDPPVPQPPADDLDDEAPRQLALEDVLHLEAGARERRAPGAPSTTREPCATTSAIRSAARVACSAPASGTKSWTRCGSGAGDDGGVRSAAPQPARSTATRMAAESRTTVGFTCRRYTTRFRWI